MELQRGVCTLCAENTKVLTSSDAEHFSKCLPKLFYDNFLPETEFQGIKNAIKICVICCHKIDIAAEVKKSLNQDEENHVSGGKCNVCYFCKTNQNVVKIEKNWKFFFERVDGFLKSNNFALVACPRCLHYFDIVYSFRTKLSNKFTQLRTHKKSGSQKQSDTPKRKSLSTSPPASTKKRKIFDNCFDYLQPLCNSSYSLSNVVKDDKRMYKAIVYVDLKNAKNFEVNETPKLRPIIKIKLKPKGKKSDKDTSFVKITRSEECPSKNADDNSRRRHSCIELKEPSEERLDETPKSAILTSVVPKRRVSTYIENRESQETKEAGTEDETSQPVPEAPSEEAAPEEKIEEPVEESKEAETNGLDKSDERVGSEEESENNVKNVVNGSHDENLTSAVTNFADSPNSSPKSDTADSDSSDKDKSSANLDDGSERKKKRVTFSDEVLE